MLNQSQVVGFKLKSYLTLVSIPYWHNMIITNMLKNKLRPDFRNSVVLYSFATLRCWAGLELIKFKFTASTFSAISGCKFLKLLHFHYLE